MEHRKIMHTLRCFRAIRKIAVDYTQRKTRTNPLVTTPQGMHEYNHWLDAGSSLQPINPQPTMENGWGRAIKPSRDSYSELNKQWFSPPTDAKHQQQLNETGIQYQQRLNKQYNAALDYAKNHGTRKSIIKLQTTKRILQNPGGLNTDRMRVIAENSLNNSPVQADLDAQEKWAATRPQQAQVATTRPPFKPQSEPAYYYRTRSGGVVKLDDQKTAMAEWTPISAAEFNAVYKPPKVKNG